MTVGDRIRKLRENAEMSQDDLAQIIGYKSKTSIHKVEQGMTDLPLSKVVEFANALKTTPAYLMGWEDEEEQPKEQPTQRLDDFSKIKNSNIRKIARNASHLTEDEQEQLLRVMEAMFDKIKDREW